jgi:hypothetical protein
LASWIKEVKLEFGKSTYVDFSAMAKVTETQMIEARKYVKLYATTLRSCLSPGSLLCIPTTPSIAPLRTASYTKVKIQLLRQ